MQDTVFLKCLYRLELFSCNSFLQNMCFSNEPLKVVYLNCYVCSSQAIAAQMLLLCISVNMLVSAI